MKKVTLLTTAILVSACGGGGGGDEGSNVDTVNLKSSISTPPGIYSGTVTPTGGAPDDAVALVTTDDRIAIVDLVTLEAFMGNVTGVDVDGAMFSSSVVPATGKVTSISGNNINGTYDSSLGGGTFALVADPNLYNRGASLNKLTGVWVDSIFTNTTGTTTWVIQADGSFAMTSTSGCAAQGDFSLLDPSKNEYGVDITVTNCLSYNGTYSGIGALSDTYNNDDTLSFMFSNGSVAGLFEPVKQ
ncbi:hypothetical protein Tel_17005 (plasmid) [Candidatus Tenderia electrophaga]|jgi:hypothetical protein|uniref:Uncharacterized protein n=1 Tax=Candidatus Tenderia electrophaga TaxID=1748243 RepID=A0A0S2TIH2_9GAMM|nr:hypothetical protein Tel_17005 [Candidatus Tenderia electrophaga]